MLYFTIGYMKGGNAMYRYTLLGKLRFAKSPKDSDFLHMKKPELMTSFDGLHQKASSLIDESYKPLHPIGFLSETYRKTTC